ncbi:gamma-glutamylcyclotransferase [Desulfonema magnum]|uniref:GGACT domain-containing protein n=1 Tax=Desulfonema magnum TaxID=45655 RepID=A0A975GWK3_9BACT|nr:gamma-glutamylcyclotransferase [Desulfonema magnum]QTA93958.1 GGACT domain-containing protein [Desulfonema magnum]
MKVFVYGTLLKGMSRFGVLADSRFMGHGFIRGLLYDLGDYPAIRQGDSLVYGELYEISREKRHELDRIEGYFSQDEPHSLYLRNEAEVTLLNDGSREKASAYFYNQALEDCQKIVCGDYRRYKLEALSDRQWYIAYGSNMSSERLYERIGKAYEVKTGQLEGYKLRFNKIADSGGTYANIAYIGSGCQCPFAAYAISQEQLYPLDRYEGEPSHYVRMGLPFSDMTGKLSHIGHVYIANPNRLTQNENPSHEYLRHIRIGYEEHGFDTSSLPKPEI